MLIKLRTLFFIGISFMSYPLSAQSVTFSKDIAPIIFQKCTPCHRPGQIGPMPLTNYEEVVSYGTMIGYVTKTGYMPPWKANKGIHALEEESHLSEEELMLIQEWVANELPVGDEGQVPPLPSFADAPYMEKPDLTISMSESFEQYGVYYDQYRVFVLPTDLEEDKVISAIEFVPGSKSIVRGAMISIDTSTVVQAFDEWDPQYGYFSFGELGFIPYESRWYNWNPGKKMTTHAKGEGIFLPKGAKILLHIHYGPTGVPLQDSSFINLKFSTEKKVNRIFTAPLIHPYNMTNDSFFIPANETIRYHAKFVVPFDMELKGVFPHSHLLGKKWDIFAVSPDQKTSFSLLKIEDWDFSWKQMYTFQQPISLKKGMLIHALATYNNTSQNLLNPSDPPQTMHWGKRMFEEMFMVYFSIKASIDSANRKCHFELLPGPINITDPLFEFNFKTKKTGVFSCTLKDFDGNIVHHVFTDQSFRKGTHQSKINLNKLAKGNYFVELKSADQVVQQLFVYL